MPDFSGLLPLFKRQPAAIWLGYDVTLGLVFVQIYPKSTTVDKTLFNQMFGVAGAWAAADEDITNMVEREEYGIKVGWWLGCNTVECGEYCIKVGWWLGCNMAKCGEYSIKGGWWLGCNMVECGEYGIKGG